MIQPEAEHFLPAHSAGAQTLGTMDGAGRYNRWIFDRVRGALGQRVLEIGCGTGTITSFLTDRQLVVGVDVDEDFVRLARTRFRGNPNVVILQHDVTRATEALCGYSFDSALSVNVFEHIEDDVAALQGVHNLLKAHGTLTLLVPGHPFLLSEFDGAIGHRRRYTKADLAQKLERAGFHVECIRRSNPVGAFGWFVNTKIWRSRQLRGVAIYDRLVPVLAALDQIVEFPVGLSLVAVARKV